MNEDADADEVEDDDEGEDVDKGEEDVGEVDSLDAEATPPAAGVLVRKVPDMSLLHLN